MVQSDPFAKLWGQTQLLLSQDYMPLVELIINTGFAAVDIRQYPTCGMGMRIRHQTVCGLWHGYALDIRQYVACGMGMRSTHQTVYGLRHGYAHWASDSMWLVAWVCGGHQTVCGLWHGYAVDIRQYAACGMGIQ